MKSACLSVCAVVLACTIFCYGDPQQQSNDTSTAPNPGQTATKTVNVSQGISQGLLIHKVRPVYPQKAIKQRIQGTVVLTAIIGKNGAIRELHVISGPPELTSAALDAVKQWRYKPYFLNGQAVDVETTININFNLEGS
jgi:periplasmic protein TonB